MRRLLASTLVLILVMALAAISYADVLGATTANSAEAAIVGWVPLLEDGEAADLPETFYDDFNQAMEEAAVAFLADQIAQGSLTEEQAAWVLEYVESP